MVSGVLNNPNIVPTAKVYTFANIKIGKDDSQNADLVYGQISPLYSKIIMLWGMKPLMLEML